MKVKNIITFLLVAIILVSCAPAAKIFPTATIVPTLTFTPTPTSLYTHYTPSKGSNIRLEFDYPSSWVFTEDMQYTGFIDITLNDPRFRALPTPSGSHPTPSDLGLIGIWITPVQPGQTADTELESHKQSYSEISRMKVLNDYKTNLDGVESSVLEYETDDQETSPSLMFNRRTFFIIKDQMYEIYYTVAEKDRGGEFDQGYEHFFNSLKIVQKY
jgi:hypothetical protein